MKKVNSNQAERFVNEENNVNEMGGTIVATETASASKKVIPQNSKQAEKLIRKSAAGKAKEEPEKATKAAEPKNGKSVKAAKEPAAPKVKKTTAYVEFFTSLIKTGKMTQKEIAAKGKEQFPEAKESTLVTLLIDAKNPKYNKFEKLVVRSEAGVLSFAKC